MLRKAMDFAQRGFVATSILGSLWVCFNVGMFAYESAQKRRAIAAASTENNNNNNNNESK
jgi:hypothetical protein